MILVWKRNKEEGAVYLVTVENEIQFAHILKVLVQALYKHWQMGNSKHCNRPGGNVPRLNYALYPALNPKCPTRFPSYPQQRQSIEWHSGGISGAHPFPKGQHCHNGTMMIRSMSQR